MGQVAEGERARGGSSGYWMDVLDGYSGSGWVIWVGKGDNMTYKCF